MKRIPSALLLAAWIGAAACDDPAVREIPVGEDAEPAEVDATAGTAPSALTTVEPEIRAALRPVGGSGVGGEVVLAEQGLATAARVTVSGVTEGETLYGHLHPGGCATADDARSDLEDLGTLRVGPGGTMEFVIERTLQELVDGGFSVGLHRSGGTPDLACADVAPPR